MSIFLLQKLVVCVNKFHLPKKKFINIIFIIHFTEKWIGNEKE